MGKLWENIPHQEGGRNLKAVRESPASGALEAEEIEAIIAGSCTEVSEVFAAERDPARIREFFSCLFTPSEVREFSLRWALVNEMLAGKTQREIARRYGMSLCKITRGSRELKRENSPFRRMIEMHNELQKRRTGKNGKN